MFKQKFHIGDNVFFLENKRAANGGFLRNDYVLKDGIVTGVIIATENNLISRKKYVHGMWTGKPDIVRINTAGYATSERYQVNTAVGMVDAIQLFATEKEAEVRFNKMKQEYPEVTLENNIEGYEVEFV